MVEFLYSQNHIYNILSTFNTPKDLYSGVFETKTTFLETAKPSGLQIAQQNSTDSKTFWTGNPPESKTLIFGDSKTLREQTTTLVEFI